MYSAPSSIPESNVQRKGQGFAYTIPLCGHTHQIGYPLVRRKRLEQYSKECHSRWEAEAREVDWEKTSHCWEARLTQCPRQHECWKQPQWQNLGYWNIANSRRLFWWAHPVTKEKEKLVGKHFCSYECCIQICRNPFFYWSYISFSYLLEVSTPLHAMWVVWCGYGIRWFCPQEAYSLIHRCCVVQYRQFMSQKFREVRNQWKQDKSKKDFMGKISLELGLEQQVGAG